VLPCHKAPRLRALGRPWPFERLSLTGAAFLIVAASSLSSCSNAESRGRDRQSQPGATPIFEVSAQSPVSSETSLSLSVSGNLVEEQSSPVTVISGGRVLSARATVGSYVERGSVLMEIDGAEYQARLDQAKAAEAQSLYTLRQTESSMFQENGKPFDPNMQPSVLTAKDQYESAREQNDIAQRQLESYKRLLKSGDVSGVSVDQIEQQATSAKAALVSAFIQYEGQLRAAKNSHQSAAVNRANYESAQAARKVAENNLAACTLRSPIAGYVLSRQYSPGDFASTGSVAITIIKTHPILLNARIPEGHEQEVRPGLEAVVHVPSYPDRTFSGAIRNVSPALDVNSRALIATISIPNKDGALKPGMFGSAMIQLPGKEKALWISDSAVVPGVTEGSPIVFVLAGDIARARVVRLSDATDGKRRVYSGLTGQDRIVVNGAKELFDGAQVRLK
jgi:RND family efflux transporter MFP subunit